MRQWVVLPMIILMSSFWSQRSFADAPCSQEASAKIISLQGEVAVDSKASGEWHGAGLNQTLCEGDRVWVKPNSRVSLGLPGNDVLRLNENTVLTLKAIDLNKQSLLDIVKGFIHFIARKPREVKIESGIANAAPFGTEFAFKVDESKAELWVYEGGVQFYNQYGSVKLKSGQAAEAYLGKAPQIRIDLKPQDAVNWALYYPPLLPKSDGLKTADPAINAAITDYKKGRIDLALQRLDALPTAQQTPYFYKVRGAMRLIVGQVDLAKQDIKAIASDKPNDADALALQAVIALTQNRKDEAFDLANKAILSDPQSATAYTALSYAEQGRFNLDKALEAANTAVKHAPNDAMVLAHKAELELAQGLVSNSEETAEQAIRLDADLERTQTVKGFSHLMSMDTDEAKQAFNKAIALDSAAPLPRLGLGLAKIRDGDLEEGRKDIEIAANLDPNNSLVRSYLGKAYYEENRSNLADDQFNLAKQRDPKDPTPYFYNALKKQTDNRPIAALRDLQKAMELNDNRAVYRSKQLLDADRAARGATLARIYDNLGFQQRGVVEAISSLQTDPANYSAHRFLSDSYVSQPGRETAQLSELLQAKLLQPININPVQPHLSVSQRGLLTTSGIANSSFQDFTRLYEGNRPQLLVSGVAGNQGILGDEVTLSGIVDNFSYSLGQFYYETDGFARPYGENKVKNNTHQMHNIYDAFLQWAINDRINIQFEYINRDTHQGFSQQTIEKLNELSKENDRLRENIYRSGAHLYFSNHDNIVFSYIHKDILDHRDTTPGSKNEIVNRAFDTNIFEAQYIHSKGILNDILGFTYYSEKKILESGGSPIFLDNRGFRAYNYLNLSYLNTINGTIGITYEYLENKVDPQPNPKNGIYPKFGFLWDINKNIKYRFAYFKNRKKPFSSMQTIEPTQISGFNQFFDDFDDFDTRKYSFYGTALDFVLNKNLLTGIELFRWDIFNANRSQLFLEKDTANLYLNWLLSDQFSLVANLKLITDIRTDINKISTHSLSLEGNYFDYSGFFGKIKWSYIDQSKSSRNFIVVGSDNDTLRSSFFTLDASIGYRFPNRHGLISLDIKNLFDKNFRYEDLGIDQKNIYSNVGNFIPQRTIFGKITINF